MPAAPSRGKIASLMSTKPPQGTRPHDPVKFTDRMLARRRDHPHPADPERYAALFEVDAYPRSARYDPAWFHFNHMGPNVLWLTEALTAVIDLQPGMRVLDMGCGTALSSIFLAREFGVTVWAADLWVSPHDNWDRVIDAGLEDRVFPVRAEAHDLPFPYAFFEVAISADAYHYFGTDELYLPYYASFVRDEGTIGIVVPGSATDVDEFPTFRSPAWWQSLWSRSGAVDVETADMLPDGRQLWYRFLEAEAAWDGSPVAADRGDAAMLNSAAGRDLGFTRVVARRRSRR